METRAKKCTKFRWFFGVWANLVFCFRDLLTFKNRTTQDSQSKIKEEFQNNNVFPFQPVRIAAFSLNSSRTAFAKRKQEAQVERLTTQFKHANIILITNAAGPPRLARPPRPGPCLDFGFQ